MTWETWPEEQLDERGRIWWQTLAQGEGLTLGHARLPAGEELREHHHAPAEIYYVLEGAGEVTVSGAASPVAAGSHVFIPGNARHGIRNTGTEELRFVYVLQASSFEDVEYVF